MPSTIAAGNRLRCQQPAYCLDDDEHDQCEQRERVDERGEHLGARVAVGRPTRRRTARDPVRQQREAQRRGIGEHVTGIGQQRQRSGHPAADRLDDTETRR